MRPFFLLAALLTPGIALAQPVVTEGQIGTAVIDVTKSAASPVFSLTLSGNAQSIFAQYQSPSGIMASEAFSAATTQYTGIPLGFTGQVVLQGYVTPSGGNGSVLPIYAEPGIWTLTNLAVCDNAGCSQYNDASLARVFKKKLTFKVANKAAPDVTPPSAASASIATPTVSISAGTIPLITVNASDSVSGVYAITAVADLSPPTYPITFSNQIPSQPVKTGAFSLLAALPANQTPGSYTVNTVTLTDIAGNTATISDPASISALFGGKTSFTVTP